MNDPDNLSALAIDLLASITVQYLRPDWDGVLVDGSQACMEYAKSLTRYLAGPGATDQQQKQLWASYWDAAEAQVR